MLETDSALYDLIAAPALAAVFAFHYYRPMPDTDSALNDLIAAPAAAAEFVFHYRRTFRGCQDNLLLRANQDVGQESDRVSSSHTASLTWFAWLSFH
jgi:hypothetical protein